MITMAIQLKRKKNMRRYNHRDYILWILLGISFALIALDANAINEDRDRFCLARNIYYED